MGSNENKYRNYLILVIAVILLTGGFFLGRSSVKVRVVEKTKYIKGDSIIDSIPYPDPIYINYPIDTVSLLEFCIKNNLYWELFPYKVKDSIIYLTKEDTAAVIKDWMAERIYEEQLFDIDTVGSCSISARIQFNRLRGLSYTFVPVTKVVSTEIVKESKYHLYLGAGISTNGLLLVEGSMFEQNWGFSLGYSYNYERKLSGVILTVHRKLF